MSNNNQLSPEIWQLAFVGVAIGAIGIAIVIVGPILAVIAVAAYAVNEWRKIYRYEGKERVFWLVGITALCAPFLISGAIEEFRLSTFYLEHQNQGDKVFWHGLMGVCAIAAIIVPTVVYEIYRAIKPISPIKIQLVEQAHRSYGDGRITRLERNALLAELFATDDDEIERRHAEYLRQQEAPRQTGGAAFDVPEQN